MLAIGGGPAGKPYEATGWELFAPLIPLFESGETSTRAPIARRRSLADDPPYAAVYYNTACFEARAGRTDDALAHLRRAIELSPKLAELARGDDDLASLRGQAAFTEIAGG